jgi:O-acetyl-ADP-ribose deacetylase (regulator of RNase III)
MSIEDRKCPCLVSKEEEDLRWRLAFCTTAPLWERKKWSKRIQELVMERVHCKNRGGTMKQGKFMMVVGDVTEPCIDDTINHQVIIIPHVCNDLGVFGAGVAKAIAHQFPQAKEDYMSFMKFQFDNPLGEVIWSEVENDRCETLYIANMIAQHGIIGKENPIPLDYEALNEAMDIVTKRAKNEINCSIHCPKFGCGLAGGDWKIVEKMIEDKWVNIGIDVTVYVMGKQQC